MCKLAISNSSRKLLYCFTTIFLLISPLNYILSQCTLACKQQVNISINDTGIATITPAMVLANPQACSLPLTVDVMDTNGNSLGDIVDCSFIGQLLMVRVSTSDGYNCMGSITMEDKYEPVINCKNDTLACNIATDPASIGFPTVFDNCDANPVLTYSDQIDDPDCLLEYSAKITRTWMATDNSNNTGTCLQIILIRRADINDVLFPDNWDDIQNPSIDCATPNTNPSFTGIPTINGMPIDSYCELMVFQEDTQIDACEGDYIIQRKWKVFDWCAANIVAHLQIIKVVDKTAPNIICPPDLTFGTDGIDCTGTVNLQNASATDDCSSQINISSNWAYGNGLGSFSNIPLGKHIVNYIATDDCGNSSTCQASIEVIDDDPPVAICKTNLVVSLNADTTKIYATAFNKASFDNCALDTNSYRIRRMEDTLFAECIYFNCGDTDTTIMVVFEVCDTTGLCNSCMVSVDVQDKTNPTITCPANTSLDCSDYPPNPTQTGMATAFDNCGIDSIFYTDVENLNLCKVGTIIRTWTAVDHNGRMASCIQTISIGDSIPPVYSFPPDLTVACLADTSCNITGKPTAIDDCGLFAIGLANEIVLEFVPNCSYKILREWIIHDECTMMDSAYTQLIIVKDSIPPVWDQIQGSLDRNFICASDLVLPTPPTATDVCNNVVISLVADDTTTITCANKYTQVLSYEATDDCGNTSLFSISLTVNDTISPSADTLPDLGPYNCYLDIPSENILDVMNKNDNCAGEVIVSFISDSADPICMGVVDRIYQLTDICGNTSEIHQRIFIKDTLAPIADPLPILPSFACYADIPAANINDVTGEIDNCGGIVNVSHISDSADPGCTGSMTRIYRLSDACNNSRDLMQIFTINDSIPPSANPLADIGPIDCYDNIPMPNVLDVLGEVDNCSTSVSLSFVEDGPNPGCAGIVIRSYRLVDVCGNADTIFQNIIIDDDLAPTADPLPSLGSFACYDSLPDPDISLVQNEMDNCDSMVVVSFLEDSADPGCTGMVTRTYQLTDICGNTSNLIQTAFINDSISPVLTCPTNVTVDIFPSTNSQCQTQVNLAPATAIDNCGDIVLITNDTFPAGGANASGIYPVGTTTVFFTATDNCGNSSTCSTTVTVRDISPPNPSCNSTITYHLTLGQTLTIKPDNLDNGTSEECSNFTSIFQVINGGELTFADSLNFECIDAGVNTASIKFTNEFGVSSFCFVSLFIDCSSPPDIPSAPMTGGSIFTPTTGPIKNVSVYVSEDMEDMHYTQDAGFFLFENIPEGSNITIEPKKNDDLLNGVSGYDLVLISKHLLNIERILDPYKLIAADVDNSGNISVFDIIALRKAILHISTDFPNNESWRFMDADHLITNPSNPYSFPESRSINNLSQHELNLNFRGIKIGDINTNTIPNNLLETEVRNPSSVLYFEVENQFVKKGEEIKIAFQAKDFQAIQAFQASFEFDTKALSFISWKKANLQGLETNSFGLNHLVDGKITWAWFDTKPQTQVDGVALFYLKFKAKENGRLSDFIQINSSLTQAEAYQADGKSMPLSLHIKENKNNASPNDFILLQNTPNPFSESTQIGFYLPKKEHLSLSIYDEAGKIIYQKEHYFEKGYQEVNLTNKIFPQSGIYFYQLQAGKYYASKKMIFIKN